MATITRRSGFQFTIKDEDLGRYVQQKQARARKEMGITAGVLTVFVVLVAAAGQITPASPSPVVHSHPIH
jgi:hypothetical protein